MRLLDRTVVRFGNLVAWLFLIVAGIIVYEVVARHLFNAPTFRAHETTVLLCALAFILGGAGRSVVPWALTHAFVTPRQHEVDTTWIRSVCPGGPG